MSDARELYHIAEAVTDDAERLFMASIGAAPKHFKAGADFATQADHEIEAYLRTTLTTLTGIPVFGEEFGGDSGSPMWVVDPIDGTANYAAGNPMSAILISLLVDSTPVLGITSVPMARQRFGAFDGSPLFFNGQAQPPLEDRPIIAAHVGFSSISSPRESRFSSQLRQGWLAEISKTYLRPRITGSVGVDLAYTAAGIFDGAVSLSPFVWDNAAGVVLVRAAGGVVTDLAGNPWVPGAEGVVVGSPRAHEALMSTMEKFRFPHPE
ncbi:inositol monophosphatase family protein [Corynebacterium sp. 153RC1]|uniref:inositol monophosphatase family protein n=1 Tax=Corynebacterium TaxID=1716 RepID=UPI00211BFC2F|nr:MULTISPECIES: inositol monophosphatase family protein [unclassified Corynebacterium]MCQ9370300.1 inositol monophosphatase family protein [Corynebacterium sp. 35RC1]MCQ9342337.1 inositol monophosphatase family protein [Corynebacterium sp. 76QC2CO]MCQ9351674.1 inositol monophosphatase family protein [Corynebacterium sp. 209RC1]MCQ9354043.1 inositol monophosphatase family protein [Corynebacterium sp. 1222RC1]MCQ9355957.1 inositol monophosphatase family protein [Corynebacterium sp. 122RC1]